jgi:ABC-type Fe3+-hydroxamate transport system substrate-binding protein
VVGRHQWDMVLPDTLPVCGDQNQIDLEALIAARPTHVITQWGQRDLPAAYLDLADRSGWQTHDARLLSLDDIEREVTELGRFLGLDPHGPMDHMRIRLSQALSRRGPDDGTFSRAGRVLLLGAVDPPAALGPASCHAQALERVGGRPAITEGGAWIELDREDLLALAPEGIIAVIPRAPGARVTSPFVLTGEAALDRLPLLRGLDLAAVRSGRVALIDDPLALTPSTHIAGFADQVVEVLTGWDTGR